MASGPAYSSLWYTGNRKRPAHASGCFHVQAGQSAGHKLHIVLLEQFHELCEVHDGTANPIQLVDDHPLNQAQLDVLQKPLEVGALNVLARVALVFVFLTLTAFKLITAKLKLTFNADTVLFVNRLPPVNCIYSTIHN